MTRDPRFANVRRLSATQAQIDGAWQRLQNPAPRRARYPLALALAGLAALVLWMWPRAPVPERLLFENLSAQSPRAPEPRPQRILRKPKVRTSEVSLAPFVERRPAAQGSVEIVVPPLAPEQPIQKDEAIPKDETIQKDELQKQQPAIEVKNGEAELLAQAVGALRRSHDARAALEILNEHRRQYPAGELSEEARLLRIEALIAAGRRADALIELDASARLRSDLALLRAELRAEAGRCREALPEFIALDGERAWWGRAVCEMRLEDRAAARRDLGEYLRRFPDGAHAKEAKRELAE